MLRPKKATADPSADAAAMLRRLGFALLFFGFPVSALFARRAIVIVAPVAVVLILLAAMLDGGARAPVDKLLAVLSSRAGLAGGILFFWAILSLLWTPFVVEASERLLNILAMVAMAMVGYLAVPDRMRSANLYILPVGVGMAALMGMIALFREGPMGEAQSLDRGMILLVLLLWPALTWLHSRGRNLEALLLAVIVALGALFAADSLALQALSIGAFAFALTAVMPAAGSRLIAGVMAGLLLLAPLLPFILEPLGGGDSRAQIQRGCEPFRLARRHPVRTSAPDHRPRAGDGLARAAFRPSSGKRPMVLSVRDLVRARSRRRGGGRDLAVFRGNRRPGRTARAGSGHHGGFCERLCAWLPRGSHPTDLVADRSHRRGADLRRHRTGTIPDHPPEGDPAAAALTSVAHAPNAIDRLRLRLLGYLLALVSGDIHADHQPRRRPVR